MKKMMFTMEGNLFLGLRKIKDTYVMLNCVCLPRRSKCRWNGLWAICLFFRSERSAYLKKRRTIPDQGLPTVLIGCAREVLREQ